MDLQFLAFDSSEDAEGVVCWDALAQPHPRHNRALLQEVASVLTWAHRWSLQQPGPLEDGADFDFALGASQVQAGQSPKAIDLAFDPDSGQITGADGSNCPSDVSMNIDMALSLSLSCTPAFAQAFRDHWGAP